MKKNYFILLFLSTLILNCKKTDYREQYLGFYSCDSSNDSYLEVIKTESENGIKIGGVNAILYENGSFETHISGTYYGHFTNDSLFLGDDKNTKCVKID